MRSPQSVTDWSKASAAYSTDRVCSIRRHGTTVECIGVVFCGWYFVFAVGLIAAGAFG
jgi:hypothetical protein